jgi:hypothetical protein
VHPQGKRFRIGPCGEVLLGPQVPHVIPRLLAMPTVVVVLSQTSVKPGHLVYLMTYFAWERPLVSQLVAPWYADRYDYIDERGARSSRADDDPVDFDFGPWLKEDKVRWCASGSDNRRLESRGHGVFPYSGIEGDRSPQRVAPGKHSNPKGSGAVDQARAERDDPTEWYAPRGPEAPGGRRRSEPAYFESMRPGSEEGWSSGHNR